MVHRPNISYRIPTLIAFIIAGTALSACGSGDDAAPVQEISAQGAGTQVAGQNTPTPGAIRITSPGATMTAGSSNIEISPTEVALGNLVLTLSVQPAQPVFDPGRTASGGTEGDAPGTPVPQSGYTVLGGSTLRVTNNFDSAQNPPADQPREVLRHVGLQIRDKTSGQLIPYVVVTMDLLREGRSTLQDQALVPMMPSGGGIAEMHYGNNVKFPGRGEYQVFIRMDPNPLIGSSSMGVAQFNVSIK